jgi:hypothetical protein
VAQRETTGEWRARADALDLRVAELDALLASERQQAGIGAPARRAKRFFLTSVERKERNFQSTAPPTAPTMMTDAPTDETNGAGGTQATLALGLAMFGLAM